LQRTSVGAEAGVLGTARIAISDVELKQASLGDVRAVTGHEIGHYVLGQVWREIIVLSALAMLLVFVADRLFLTFARAKVSNKEHSTAYMLARRKTYAM
jgi:Zn-dependent protease with chaperone function